MSFITVNTSLTCYQNQLFVAVSYHCPCDIVHYHYLIFIRRKYFDANPCYHFHPFHCCMCTNQAATQKLPLEFAFRCCYQINHNKYRQTISDQYKTSLLAHHLFCTFLKKEYKRASLLCIFSIPRNDSKESVYLFQEMIHRFHFTFLYVSAYSYCFPISMSSVASLATVLLVCVSPAH